MLVNADLRYWVPSVASPLAVFNHAITYIPEFDVYVDSTAGTARFGVLPFNEAGKRALLTGVTDGDTRLVTLPLTQAGTDSVTVATEIMFGQHGDGQGHQRSWEPRANMDWIARSIFSQLRAGSESHFAQLMLTASGADGTGRYVHGDIHNLKEPLSYSTVFEIPDFHPYPRPGAMRVPRGLGGLNNIASAFDGLGTGKRRSPLLFKGGHFSETTRVDLPISLRVTSLPKPAVVASSFGSYKSSYAVEGGP